MEQQVIEQIVSQVLAEILAKEPQEHLGPTVEGIPVGISNRHIHLSAQHLEALFGRDYALTPYKKLKQPGEFAAKETVTLVGPKSVMRGVRVLGPLRKFTQIEISRTDGFALGVVPPLRDSGQIEDTPGIVVVGPRGAINLQKGVICAARHIHMSSDDALKFHVLDGDRVSVKINGPRGGTFDHVLVRAKPNFVLEFHIDTDEANAAGLKNGDTVSLDKREH